MFCFYIFNNAEYKEREIRRKMAELGAELLNILMSSVYIKKNVIIKFFGELTRRILNCSVAQYKICGIDFYNWLLVANKCYTITIADNSRAKIKRRYTVIML